MITNFNNKNRKDDIKALLLLIVCFIFVVWLFTPPGNKFAQLALYGNNTQFLIAKLTKSNEELNEWRYHHNNAVYYVRMNNKEKALAEINNAISSFPAYLPESKLLNLYLVRAKMRLYYKDYNGALSDYMQLKSLSMLDKFRVALLFKQVGNKRYALSYCTEILNIDSTAYIGYACLADIYASAGKYDVAVRVYDLLLDRSKNRAKYYVDRAEYKKLCCDIDGYNADIEKAKSMSSSLDTPFMIINDTLNPKVLHLDVLK